MTNGWDGADPTGFDDGSLQYELATRFQANDNITISAIRVWEDNTLNVPNRNARIWNTGGSVLATIDIDDSLPTTGWTTYNLITPLDVSNGTTFDVSYSTQRYYGLTPGLYPNPSSDSLVTATQGRFAETMGLFPNNTSTNFYGIDIIYTLNDVANDAPQITGMSVTKSDLTATATVNIIDEDPATVVMSWDWGDGNVTTTAAGVTTAQHTYTVSGLYAVLATATDGGGLTDAAAQAITVTVPIAYTDNEEWIDDIFDAVVSDVQRSGYFDKVNKHEPKRKPGTGLTAAVWVAGLGPANGHGLAATSALLVFTLRIYSNMLKEPQDMIDPEATRAMANLIRRYHDDFDFGGLIRNVDLLGATGSSLNAVSGYLEIDDAMFRVFDLTIPCIVNDVWPQAS